MAPVIDIHALLDYRYWEIPITENPLPDYNFGGRFASLVNSAKKSITSKYVTFVTNINFPYIGISLKSRTNESKLDNTTRLV